MEKRSKLKNVMFCTVVFLLILGFSLTLTPGSVGAQEEAEEEEFLLEDVVVTASKRETKLMETPLSVTAFTPERMESQGIRTVDDIARLTPGVTFNRSDRRHATSSNIAIRGVRSTVAASTTGIYLDDTPVQTRRFGAGGSAGSVFPFVFDLERVEVLKGPQGTLFGSGSEGGTVRFITPRPGLTDYSMYARSEIGFIDHGGVTYEAGAAVGGPIIEDKLGFRVSAAYRQDGGYIDRVNTDPQPGDPPLAVFDADPTTPPTVIPYRNKINYVAEENSNFLERRVVRGSLLFAPTDDLEIMVSSHYQEFFANDTNVYWELLSDPDEGRYAHGYGLRNTSKDKFWLPALTISWELGPVRLFSSTSYLDRFQAGNSDYTIIDRYVLFRYWEWVPGHSAPNAMTTDQESTTQELRLESTDPDARLQWVLGMFYQNIEQYTTQICVDPWLNSISEDIYGAPLEVVFGGSTLIDGIYVFRQDPVYSKDTMLAGFLQVDFDLTDKWTLTAGVRVTDIEHDASAYYDGLAVGPYVVADEGSASERPTTPKFSVSYQPRENNLFYATAAKGFRVGGYNPEMGFLCAPEMIQWGYTPTPESPSGRPALYKSDSLWNYELGTKNTLLGGRARLNAAVYYIDWKDIQQQIFSPRCGFGFVTNMGGAEVKGFELDATWLATDQLRLGISMGYNDAQYTETIYGGPAATTPFISEGDSIPGPPWSVNLNGQYVFLLLERESYVRFDYEYHSEGPDDTSELNVANRNPLLPPPDPHTFVAMPEETHMLSMRAGTQIGNFDISVFVKNLLNDNAILSISDATVWAEPYGPDQHCYQARTLQPRSIGVTVVYRY